MDKLDKALNEYADKFNENYPILITSTIQDDELLKRVRWCIDNNTKEKEPKLIKGMIY